MKSPIFFITGVSGSGKSTLVDYLKKDLSFAEVHDFDEGGVPDDADEKWRIERTNYWLKKIKEYKLKGKTAIICGVCVPEEIKNSPEYLSSFNIYYGFISVDEKMLKKRLKARGWVDEKINYIVMWSKHLEKYVKLEKNHYIVDGVENKPNQVAEKFISWIIKETKN
jgi:broad-specificity NMP kinase